MKLNKPLIRKIIRKLEATPTAYNQEVFGTASDEAPCGTAACIAGWACILDRKLTPEKLIALTQDYETDLIEKKARTALGLGSHAAAHLFTGEPDASDSDREDYDDGWPTPFNKQWARVSTAKGRANVAVRLLKAILKTNGKILEANEK